VVEMIPGDLVLHTKAVHHWRRSKDSANTYDPPLTPPSSCPQMRALVAGQADPSFISCANDIPKTGSLISRWVRGLAPATTYAFRVRILDLRGWQHWNFGMTSGYLKTLDYSPDPPSAPR
jgi:hypothetical protein